MPAIRVFHRNDPWRVRMHSAGPGVDTPSMSRFTPRLAAIAAVAAVALASPLGPGAPRADAALPLPSLSAPAPAPAVAPVAIPIAIDPATGPARGTVILVHGGGWAGHGAHAQGVLATTPGQIFLQRGWRVVSVDYEEGSAGLQDVLNAAGAELTRGTGAGPLCLYGESAGAHLSLLAAARMRSIDCVIGLGAPTDLMQYEADAAVDPDARVGLVGYQIARFFGTTPEETAPWDAVVQAPAIRADVLLMREADDSMVPAVHVARFVAARPATQTVELPAGDPSDPSSTFVHGTISPEGRVEYAAAIGAFADRAVAARDAERRAARLGCTGASRLLAPADAGFVERALRCLSAHDRALPAAPAAGAPLTREMRGEVSAARIWGLLRRTTGGRRGLAAVGAGRGRVTVKLGSPSVVTVTRLASRRRNR